jgi:hypothetical protein
VTKALAKALDFSLAELVQEAEGLQKEKTHSRRANKP